MSTKRELRAQKAQKKADAKLVRRVERDRRRTELNMTVVNSEDDDGGPKVSLTHAIQQTHAALLYADNVTLVSPKVALLQSTSTTANLDLYALLSELERVAPRKYPDEVDNLKRVREALDGLPPRSSWPREKRHEYGDFVRHTTTQLRDIRERLRENSAGILSDARVDELQLAVRAGILTIEPMPGASASEVDTGDVMSSGLLERIGSLLGDGGQYPLFDTLTNAIVRVGVEQGIFSPTPTARRLGGQAAMADGLFDRLPSFQYASTSEILDARSELSKYLGAFRQGVRGLTQKVDIAPEDPQFGAAVEEAWNADVAPALDDIDEVIKTNSSMADLTKRIMKDPIGGGAVVAGSTSPVGLAVATGPLTQLAVALGVVAGIGVGVTRGILGEIDEIADAKNAEFYFLYGTQEMLETG